MSALALKTGLAYPATRRRAPKLPRRSEKAFQAVVVELARALGWLCYHPYDSRRSQPGWPDLAMVRGDRFLVAELKSRIGQLTVEQQRWLSALRTAGVEVHVFVDDGDMQRIADVLTGRTMPPNSRLS